MNIILDGDFESSRHEEDDKMEILNIPETTTVKKIRMEMFD